MQKATQQKRIWGWILALLVTSTLAIACNGEAEKKEETTTEPPAATAPAENDTTQKGTLPPPDSTATTRPDGKH